MNIDGFQSDLIICLDKPSQLRTNQDLDVIYNNIKSIKAYSGLHPYLLQQMCLEVRYERLKERIVVYQGSKPDKLCYVVMSGSLIVVDIQQLPDILNKNHILYSKLFPIIQQGCAFGNNFRVDYNTNCRNPFSINLSNSKAVVTQEPCELLYMDQKVFQEIWSKNEKFFRDLNMSRDITSIESNFVANTSLDTANSLVLDDIDIVNNEHNLSRPIQISQNQQNNSIINSAYFIYKSCKSSIFTCLPTNTINKLQNSSNKFNIKELQNITTNTNVMIGEDMISWMRKLIKINSRLLAIGIWQVLLEQHILVSLTSPYLLRDSSNDFYIFSDQFNQNIIHFSNSSNTNLVTTNVSSSSSSSATASSSSNTLGTINNLDDLESSINYLMKLAPDALFRMILHKPTKERNKDELEFIYGELLHIKALSHLSSMVKRQLAMVLIYEIHPKSGKVLFYQGSEGKSWYIIVKGSVDVHIKGKGVVCRLKVNDDFGKLALVNNSPRAATIMLRENDCHFLKIDKEDFNRILRNVEINTVRLKEHGKDVLLFEKRNISDSPQRKYPSNSHTAGNMSSTGAAAGASNFSSILNTSNANNTNSIYSIMAGTPEKLIEHILEYSIDINKSYASILDRVSTLPDPILETFILTYLCFLTSHGLCSLLLVYFQSFTDNITNDGRATPIEDKEQEILLLVRKTRVVHFLYWWCRISDGAFFEDRYIHSFVENLLNLLGNEKTTHINTVSTPTSSATRQSQQMNKEFLALSCLLEQFQKTELIQNKKIAQRSKMSKFQPSQQPSQSTQSQQPSQPPSNLKQTSSIPTTSQNMQQSNTQQLIDIPPIKCKDLAKFTVYFANGSSCMLRMSVESTVEAIIKTLAKHQDISSDNLCLMELRNDGEKVLFDMEDVGIMYTTYVNSKLYLLTYEKQKEIFQNNTLLSSTQLTLSPKKESTTIFETISIDELAFHLTFLDWQLFKNIHIYELLFKVLGRAKFGKPTANLDSFIHQFSSIQFWTVTEIVQCQNANKRTNILKKLIKLANRLVELKNISSAFAVLLGLNNSAILRLQITWSRLNNKHRKIFNELCSLIDPTRNHCAFRQYLKKASSPIIPFIPIVLKDLTFINEANKTYFDDSMINYEKMQLFAITMNQFLQCRFRPMIFENSTSSSKRLLLNGIDLQFYVQNLKCITDQKQLTTLSVVLESKITTFNLNNNTTCNLNNNYNTANNNNNINNSNINNNDKNVSINNTLNSANNNNTLSGRDLTNISFNPGTL